MKLKAKTRSLTLASFRLAWLCFLLVWPASGFAPADGEDTLATIGNDETLASRPAREQAIARLQFLVKQWQNEGGHPAAARAYNRLGELYLKTNYPQAALAVHNQALNLAKTAHDAPARADSLNGLAFTYLQLHNPTAAQPLLSEAVKISQAANYPRGLAQAYNHLSFLYVQQQPLAEAVSAALKAIALWDELKDQRGAAQAHYRLGEAYLVLSRNTESLHELETSAALWRTVGNKAEEATTLIEIGFLWMRQGEWSKALGTFNQAKPLIDEDAEPYIAGQLEGGIAGIYFSYNLPEVAQGYFAESLRLFRQSPNSEAEIGSLILLARVKFLAGDDISAIAELQELLPRCHAIKDLNNIAFVHEYLGEIYLSQQKYAQALTELQAALKIYEGFPRPREMARVHTFMGQAELAQGRLAAAFHYYDKALRSYQSFHNYTNEAALYHGLGQIAMKRGKLDEAGRLFKTSLELTEKLRADGSSQDLRTAFLAKTYPRYESYIDWLMQMHQRQPTKGYDSEALLTNEQARARALLETLQQAHATLETGFDPQLVAQKRNLEQQLRLQEAKQTDLLSRRLDASAVTNELRQLNEQYGQVTQKMAALNPHFAALTQPRALRLEEINQLAPDDNTAFFEYAVGEERSYLWVVTKAGLSSYPLPGRARIEAAASALRLLLSHPANGGADRPAALRQAANELSRLILPPAAPLKPRLVIVSDGVLGFIPFQILTTAERPDEPLLEQYEIVNTPSLSTLAELQATAAQRQPSRKLIAAFGDPVFRPDNAPQQMQVTALLAPTLRGQAMAGAWRDVDDTVNPADLPPLAFSRQEVDDVTAANAAGESFKALRFDATLETLKNTDLSQFRVLHLSTHGLFNSKRPEHSGIVLSMFDRQGHPLEGFLGLGDVYNLRAPVDLVVLSACRTALGKDVRGEGLMSLTRGFMYAGASSVAASLWKVDDAATANLMKDFYGTMLREGKPPAAALRAAQRAMRQQKTWHDPFYWAAFTLNGEYRKPLIAPTPPRSLLFQPLLWLLALLAISGGIVIFWRKWLHAA